MIIVIIGIRVGIGVSIRIGVGVSISIRIGIRVGVSISIGISIGIGVGVSIGVSIGVRIGIGIGVSIGVGVRISVSVRIRVSICVSICVSIGVGVSISVSVRIRVSICVSICVSIGVGVSIGVSISIRVSICVSICVRVGVSIRVGIIISICIRVGIAAVYTIYVQVNDVASQIAHKHVCSVAGNIVGSRTGHAAAGMPYDGLFNGAAVDKIPTVNVGSVDFDLDYAVGRKPEQSTVSHRVNHIFESEISLVKGRAPENGVGNRQICRNGHGSIGRELFIAMQAKQEVDEVCVGILGVFKTDTLEYRHDGRSRFCLDRSGGIDSISTCVGAQHKNSKQKNSKYKQYGKRRLAELF